MSGAYRNTRGDVILGDVITHIDGKPVRDLDDYFSALEAHKPGERINIRTRLGEKTLTYNVELIESQ
jgi:S1-C subfamily serine protease